MMMEVDSLQPHPLIIPEILRLILPFHSVETIKNFRFVCKSWNEVGWDILKKSTTCNLLKVVDKPYGRPIENIHIVEHTMENKPGIDQDQDSGCVTEKYAVVSSWMSENGQNIRSIKYESGGAFMNPNFMHDTNCILLRNILIDYCPLLMELELNLHPRMTCPTFELTPHQLPNLKRLKLIGGVDIAERSSQKDNNAANNFLAILIAANNLKVLEISLTYNCLKAFIKIVLNGQENQIPKSLERLIWNSDLSSTTMKSLSMKIFPNLSHLELNGVFKDLHPYNRDNLKNISDYLLKMLSQHSESLKVLKINGRLESSPDESSDEDNTEEEDDIIIVFHGRRNNSLPYVALDIPFMSKLTVLDIHDIFHCRFENLTTFVNKMPMLKRLSMRNVSYASDVRPMTPDALLEHLLSPPENEVVIYQHKHLQELYLGGEILTPQGVERITKLFPYLKRLDLFVNSAEVFNIVFLKFHNLEELKLKFKGISDMEWCQAAFKNHLPEMNALRKLKLHHKAMYPLRLTESSVTKGFAEAKSLRYLELTKFSMCVTEKKNILKKLDHLMSLVFHKCSFYTPNFEAEYGHYSKCVPVPAIKDFSTESD